FASGTGAASPPSARAGARFSTAHDSRWLAPGRCTSQQLTLQNESAVRFWLQVETLHVQYTAPSAIGFLQALQRRQGLASGTRSSSRRADASGRAAQRRSERGGWTTRS